MWTYMLKLCKPTTSDKIVVSESNCPAVAVGFRLRRMDNIFRRIRRQDIHLGVHNGIRTAT